MGGNFLAQVWVNKAAAVAGPRVLPGSFLRCPTRAVSGLPSLPACRAMAGAEQSGAAAGVAALEDGAPGEVVRVQNVRTRKELIGEVIDENTIKITD